MCTKPHYFLVNNFKRIRRGCRYIHSYFSTLEERLPSKERLYHARSVSGSVSRRFSFFGALITIYGKITARARLKNKSIQNTTKMTKNLTVNRARCALIVRKCDFEQLARVSRLLYYARVLYLSRLLY